MIDTVKILEDYIATLTPTVTPTEWLVDGSHTTIQTCNTYWLTQGTIINIGGQDYKIIDLEQNEFIKINGLPSEQTFTIDAPKFFHNTLRRLNNELESITGPNEWTLKFPMIYLFEIYTETYEVSRTEPVEFRTNIRLFFFDETNIEDADIDEDYKEVIRPMRALTNYFLEPIVKGTADQFESLDRNYDIINWSNFGKFEDTKGMVKSLINENVSGIELRIELPVKKSYISSIKCKCKL